ncbi:PfkB family carbohydrate kinase [Tsukamurella sp. 8F]|uniref:PfkB family carbohydrate kinase n=1 Tax=unclassified Tsukamurella TaxID=2633480 RepID=UPI0023B9D68C|nr:MULTISPECIES: PfkB family carbohydrate kinase [unclassified Tsukamurella]MDF0530946.1 PfkB family carbohydrate kinase [Tsukamurella sp. 8J]MDF0588271.1 PfkB family carbohydrate kinase [Tsukamurella sp. 8F]
MPGRTLCLGEALIDAVMRPGRPVEEHVGGSLFNVACGLAALGDPASILSWWGRDQRGARIAASAERAGLEVVPGTDGAPRTPLARAHVDEEGRAVYDFDLTWEVPPAGGLERYNHLHTGSFAATLAPGADGVLDIVQRIRDHATVSYDPNIRPALMGTPETVRSRIEQIVGLADLVKASDEDLTWLYPDEPVENVMRRWLASGPAMVVVTRGPWGAYALLSGNRDMLHVDQLTVEVGDTVGAGDSFMAGLVSGLLDTGYLGSRHAGRRLSATTWTDVQPALHRAVITSALTVSRDGAYAPTMAEVRDVRAKDPTFR